MTTVSEPQPRAERQPRPQSRPRPLLGVDGDHFVRGGAEHRIVSGVLHYFRVLPQLWEDRLRRLAAMGCNTVETYVAWNVHQPRHPSLGPADFAAGADLPAFCLLADEVGLDVIVPGPYICAEWEFGGLPAWLLADPGMQLRCAYPGFLAAVDEWWDALLPRLAPLLATNGGPILAVQIENEYGSYGNDKTYLAHLRAGYERHGVDVLMFTSDGPTDLMLTGGTLPDVLATVNFGSEPEAAFGLLRRHRPGTPLFCVEFWNGWFDHWGGPHHVRAADTLRRMLDGGASVNFYVGHGGTNFGFYAGANHTPGPTGYQPTITSYDYDAPIGEAGELTPKFHAFREILASRSSTPLPDPPADLPRQPPQSLVLADARAVTFRGMLDTLSTPVPLVAPVPMEQLGQAYGFVHYQSVIPASAVGAGVAGTLRLVGLADRAHVFVDGRLVGALARQDDNPALRLRIPARVPPSRCWWRTPAGSTMGPTYTTAKVSGRSGSTISSSSTGTLGLCRWMTSRWSNGPSRRRPRPRPRVCSASRRSPVSMSASSPIPGLGRPATPSSPFPGGPADGCGSTGSTSARTVPKVPRSPSTRPPRCGTWAGIACWCSNSTTSATLSRSVIDPTWDASVPPTRVDIDP